jgi:hypothetical protein
MLVIIVIFRVKLVYIFFMSTYYILMQHFHIIFELILT